MRRPKGISSEASEASCGSGVPVVSTSRSHSSATRLQPASCILERYMEVGRMVTFSRIRSIFFTEASLVQSYQTWKTDSPTRSQGNLHAVGKSNGSHRIKKTSVKVQRIERFAGVRCRDKTVAWPDTLRGSGTTRQPHRVESQRGLSWGRRCRE